MSTFFIDQQRAKAKTRYLVLLYFAAIILIIFAIYLVIVTFVSSSVPNYTVDTNGISHIKTNFDYIYNPKLFFNTFWIVSLLIGSASLFKKFQLRGSGEKIALNLGGNLILSQTNNAQEKKILNIVEEMSIASGLKVPPVYIIESNSINAFAAGTTPGNAVIGISRGAIEKLSRDELQGVVAHEFSHILHGDMTLNIRLISFLFGILFVATIGRIFFRIGMSSASRRGRDDKGAVVAIGIIGFLIMLIGYIGIFFANLIKMAVSRQREFLADASAVQYTRNPLGIAGALKKIGAYSGRIKHPNAEEASHMFFANGLTNALANIFSTHPPLANRIEKLDPAFDGNYQAYANANKVFKAPVSEPDDNLEDDQNILNEILASPRLGIMTVIGSLGIQNQAAARKLISNLDQNILNAAREPYSATLLLYSLLLDEKTEIRKKQVSIIQNDLPASIFRDFQKLELSLRNTPENDFLSVLDLSIPALTQLSKSQYLQLRNLAEKLAHADEKIDLFEYTLFKILERHFNKKFYPEKFQFNKSKNVKELTQPASNLFLALSILGNLSKPEEAEVAYQAACKYCAIPEAFIHDFNDLPEVNLKFLDEALEKFINIDYKVKEVILRASVACISKDKQINKKEFALIRAIADSFDCPVPLIN